MLKKNAPRVVVILAFAAAFAAAQFPWETNSDSNYDSGSSPSDASDESSFGDPYNDIGSFTSSDSADEAAEEGGDASKQKKKAPPKAKTPREKAPPKDKPQKAGRQRTAGPSFSTAFSGPQKTCPVCASARLKGNQYVDYGGGRIHVCSATCISRVRRNPDGFANILVKRGEQVTAAR